jgi:Ca-activated chloride channel family protein
MKQNFNNPINMIDLYVYTAFKRTKLNYFLSCFVILFLLLSWGNLWAEAEESDRTASPYFFVQSSDPGIDRLPLKSNIVDVNISGVIADVTVTQVYKNEGNRAIEAIYIFPASTKAAVYGMKMQVGERTILAKIKKKEEARQEYQMAKDAGQSASLLEQHRPNVFQMSVANILPQDIIKVELKYTELLVPTDAIYQFVFPTVVGPRYVSGQEDNSQFETWTANPYLQEGELPASTFDITVSIHAGLPIREVSCNSHKVDIEYISPNDSLIRLAPCEQLGANRDYILNYRLAGDKIEAGMLLYEGKEENFFLVMMQPPKHLKLSYIPPRDYMFIVDISGSMHGFPLDISKQLLKDLIGNLRSEDRFNVLLFAGSSTVMSERSIPASEDNIQKALEIIHRQGGGGGTEILPALKRALAMPGAEGYSRNIIIATDGYVNVEVEIFDLIRRSLNNANIFAFGIGTSVNRDLIEGMARVGMGEPFVITDPQEAGEVSKKFRKLVESPVLTDITIDYRGFDAYDVEPLSIPDIMAERPVIVFGKYQGNPGGTVHLQGRYGGMIYENILDVSRIKPFPGNSALRYLWARHKIKLLADYNQLRFDDERKEEITKLGLTYNLLTEFTSFIAVDLEYRNVDGKPDTVKQPLPLPEGVSNLALSGGLHEEVTVLGRVGVIDTRCCQVGVSIDRQMIDYLPLSRNSYASTRLAPGVMTNTEGLAERAPSSGSYMLVNRGQAYADNTTWNVDGANISDPTVLGAAPAYLNVDNYEEVEVQVGGGEISSQTGTVDVNFVTKKGGNHRKFDFSYFLAYDAFAAKVNDNKLEQWGITNANDIKEINEYTFNAGGPIIKDRLWYWLSKGYSKINSYTRADVDTISPATTHTYDLKLNMHINGNNLLDVYLHADGYKGQADNVSPGEPGGYLRQNLHSLGNPIIKIQEGLHSGNLMIDLNYTYVSSGSRTVPGIDPDYEQMMRKNQAAGVWETSYGAFYKNRNKHIFSTHLNYFMENFLRADHEVQFTAEYQHIRTGDEIRTAEPGYAPSAAFMTYNWATSQFNLDGLPGDDIPLGWEKLSIGRHAEDRKENMQRISLGFQDIITRDKWTLMLGLRYDRYQPSLDEFSIAAVDDDEMHLPRYQNYFEPEVIDLIRQWMPTMDIPAHSGKGYAVSIFSPRLGVTWDISGDGKNVLKFAAGLYGDTQSTANARYLLPYGAESGMQFWLYRDTPGKYTLNDLYWTDYTTGTPVRLFTGTTGTWQERLNPALSWEQLQGYNVGPSFLAMYYGFPLGSGEPLSNRYEIDANALSSKRVEAVLSFEKALTQDFLLGISLNYSRNYHFPWECEWFKNSDGVVIDGPQYYEAFGTIPGPIAGIPQYSPGEAAGREWYALKAAYQNNPDRNVRVQRRPGYYRDYKSIDIRFDKKYSNGFMFSGSITFQDIKQYFGKAGFLDRTNLWALDGKTYGSMTNNVSSRWLVKFAGCYKLPIGIDLAGVFTAREGNLFIESFSIKDERPVTGQIHSGDILMYEMGKKRLPVFYQLDLRLEKSFRISDTTNIQIMLDCFNVFNRIVDIARNNLDHGTLVIKPDNSYRWESNPDSWTNGGIKQVLNPRIFRLGVRFTF